jgi:hypothetical protein
VLAGAIVATALLATPLIRSWYSAGGPVVIYLVDTLRPDRMSLYGAKRETTAAALALARESITYTNAFAVSTWTRPSVATLLTSRLPASVGALNLWGRLDNQVWYLPAEFRRKGWTTAFFVGNGNVFDERLGFQRGVDLFRAIMHRNDDTTLESGLEWHATAREVVDPVVEFIEQQRSSRFFLYVHVVDPHAPYVLEPPSQSLFASVPTVDSNIPVDYDRSVHQADSQFQRIVDALQRKHFWTTSTIVYTSDHGEEFHEHGWVGHGNTVHDEQLRIPLVIRYPEGSGRGSTRADPVTLADIAPTMAHLYSLESSSEWIGSPLPDGELPRDRILYFTEDLAGDRLYGLRRGADKLIVRLYPTFSRALYRLATDPAERSPEDLPCGASPPDPTIVATLADWRQRDVASFPSLRLTDRGEHQCQAIVDFSGIDKPFLTAEDYCDRAGEIKPGEIGKRLVVDSQGGAESSTLQLSGDDHSRLPRFQILRSPHSCVVISMRSNMLDGPSSEEHLKQLRSLGYLK